MTPCSCSEIRLGQGIAPCGYDEAYCTHCLLRFVHCRCLIDEPVVLTAGQLHCPFTSAAVGAMTSYGNHPFALFAPAIRHAAPYGSPAVTGWRQRVGRSSGLRELHDVRDDAADLAQQGQHAPGKATLVFQTVADCALITTAVISSTLAAVSLWKALTRPSQHEAHQAPSQEPAVRRRATPLGGRSARPMEPTDTTAPTTLARGRSWFHAGNRHHGRSTFGVKSRELTGYGNYGSCAETDLHDISRTDVQTD
jgi:hypothetical protein